ncbi:MAG: hypothetical protein ABWY00_04300 [Dongiaceae bacterium]
MMTQNRIGKQAIVIGAGISGLAAASALVDHFEKIIVLERDDLPSEPLPRAGTPQSRHLHGLLRGGLRALDDLFPGFEDDLIKAGAVPIRVGLDILEERPGFDPFPRRDLGLSIYAMSRPAIEFAVRRRVEQLANVTFRPHCRVLDIVLPTERASFTAVRFTTREGNCETLMADLVIDASARGSLTLSCLQSAGHPLPPETIIGVDLCYATAVFAIPDQAPSDWKGVLTFPDAPESSRSGVLLPVENNRWMVTVSGRRGDWPSDSGDEFLTFVQHLRTPKIYNAIKHATRLGEITRFGFAQSGRRHFEQLGTFPRGLIPLGDTICRFNPIYGQGMSVAAQEACALRRLLRDRAAEKDPLKDLGRAFFAEIQPILDTPWTTSAVPDFIFPATRGRRPADFDNTLKFGGALINIAARDPAIHKLIAEVYHLLKPQSVYRDPALLQRATAEMAQM